ncbi:MAG: DUF4301 family protein [Bacteroidales bacterium]
MNPSFFQTQLENYKKGFPYLDILAAATTTRGIKVITETEAKEAIKKYIAFDGNIVKFVPASGAASRMFKDVFEARDLLARGKRIPEFSSINKFFTQVKNLPFYDEAWKSRSEKEVLDYILDKEGLNYGNSPKGQVIFHKYVNEYYNESRTALEEHLVEGAMSVKGKDNIVHIHFTISPEHQDSFQKLLIKVQDKYEKRYHCHYDISFSTQSTETDIIAVNPDNTPFLKEDGTLLYRPGGHGALLQNLNAIDADIIIVKNIDNVVNEKYLDETVKWKKVLAGELVQARIQVFEYLKNFEDYKKEGRLNEIKDYLSNAFCIDFTDINVVGKKNTLASMLLTKLNRPIRVCGMVKNEGEPGGGPFIILEKDGTTSLQILEGSQLSSEDPFTAKLLASATHFNPVDMICSITDYKGHKFDLSKFVDSQSGLISHKSYQGRELKAQELPGLWNGAMSNWNTMFIETPIITFNPVKKVVDLLRETHFVK